MKHNRQHFLHYLSLMLMLITGFILFFIYQGFPQTQLNIAILISFLYVIWGIIHHFLQGDLHWRIVIEYTLIAILAVVILRGALLH